MKLVFFENVPAAIRIVRNIRNSLESSPGLDYEHGTSGCVTCVLAVASEMKKIWSTPSLVKSDLVKCLLEGHGIPVVTINETSAQFTGIGLPVFSGQALAFAWPEIWVEEADYERALVLLRDLIPDDQSTFPMNRETPPPVVCIESPGPDVRLQSKDKINMETELKRIRILLGVAVFSLVIMTISDIYYSHLWRSDRQEPEMGLDGIATILDSRGEHAQLKALVQERLKTHPNDLFALYYLADAQYQLGEYKQARDTYERLRPLAPNWRDQCDERLKKITKQLADSPDA